jgi:hypothetical protein
MGSINRIVGPASLCINARPYLKITRARRAGGMAQMVECMLSKPKALSSNSSTAKGKKKAYGKSVTVSV